MAEINEEEETSSLLLKLPYEVLLDIFESVDHAPSQVALALTCKKWSSIAQHIDLSLAETSPKYAGYLPKSVFDVPDLLLQLSSWMPTNLQLCNHCLTHRPRDDDYWNEVFGGRSISCWVQKNGWNFVESRWQRNRHNICPACHASCKLSDYVDCDGCRALGRLGDVDFTRVSDYWLLRAERGL